MWLRFYRYGNAVFSKRSSSNSTTQFSFLQKNAYSKYFHAIEPDMKDFEAARTWHRISALQANSTLKSIEQPEKDMQAAGNDAKCDLGKWIQGKSRCFSSLPEFADLIDKHKKFHQTASLLLKSCEAGAAYSLKPFSISLFAASDAVLKAMNALLKVAKTVTPAAFADQDAEEFCYQGWSFWRDSVLIGLKNLDCQRRELAIPIEKLNDEPSASISSEYFSDCKSALEKLATLHFTDEEIFMRKIAFPAGQMADHIKDHDGLLNDFNQIDFDAMLGNSLTSTAIYRKIKDNIRSHIARCDVPLAEYVANLFFPGVSAIGKP